MATGMTSTNPVPGVRERELSMTAPLRRSIAGATLAAALCLPAGAPAAAPAPVTYTVHSCRGPEGDPVATRAWQGDIGDTGVTDACAKGGALTVEAAGPSGGPALLSGVRFAAPPGTAIAGYRIHLTAATRDAPTWKHLEAGLAVGSFVGLPPIIAGCTDPGCTFGDEGDPLSDDNLVTASGLPVSGLVLAATCVHGSCEPPDPDPEPGAVAARARLWSSAVDVVDPAAPVLGTPSGSLLAPGPVSGRASVSVPASDAGGGVASVVLRVDGAERARLDAGGDCAQPYVIAAPCPATLPASLELDTRTLADGPHAAELVVTDAAGRTAASGPLSFSVANTGTGTGGAGSAGGAGPTIVVTADPARAEIAVDRTRFTLPARGARITGSVRRRDGAPAAGAQLVVRSRRFGADAPRPADERTLRADASGRFSMPLGTTPRRLTIVLDDPGYRSAESDEVQVRGDLRVVLKAVGRGLRNGSTVTLDARLSGAGDGASGGRPVLVQALVGGRWATVDSVEAQRNGRATWRYRFRSTTRATVYRFRVRVPRGGADWPWPATTSRAVSVRVRP